MSSSTSSLSCRPVVEQVLWSSFFQQLWFPYPTGLQASLWTTFVQMVYDLCPFFSFINHRCWSYDRLLRYWKDCSYSISYQEFLRQHAVSDIHPFLWGLVYTEWKPSMKEWLIPVIQDLAFRSLPVLNAESVIRRFLSRQVVPWYRHRRWTKGILVLRHRKAGQEDRHVTLTYPCSHSFWSVAFQGRFSKDQLFGKGSFLIPLGKIKVTYEAVEVYQEIMSSRPRLEKQQKIEEYTNVGGENVEMFTERIGHLLVLAEMWDDPSLYETFQLGMFIQEWFTEYVETTLYDTKKVSMIRIRRFVEQSPVLGEYLWKTNFAKESSRRSLAIRLGLATKHVSAFVRSSTWEDLRQWIRRKEEMGKSIYDKVPKELQQKWKLVENLLQECKSGVPIGLHGRYISSDAIQVAQQRRLEVKKEMDRWIAKHGVLKSS